MRLDAQQHRYGIKILVINQGTWFWSEPLCDISFVLRGQRERASARFLATRHNNPAGALAKALAATAAMLEREEL
jgi:hypothetical protein